MRRLVRRLLRSLAALPMLWLGLAAAAAAHELSMAEMELRQLSPTEFIWQWTASGNRPVAQELTPRWPEGCRAEGQALLCGAEGLKGTLAIDGVGKRYSAALVKLVWLDGNSYVYTLTAGQPTVRLLGGSRDTRSTWDIAGAYAALGVEHILGGDDHLLFVLGLLFLVGFERRLVGTITAFTLAHSLTLALAATGWLVLRSPPVEAAIALSIVLVAGEALHTRPTLSRRWPALVAFGFGLIHGLGFAGALKEVGLPEHDLPAALLAFNLGVEAGQLLVVAAVWLLVTLLGQRLGLARWRRAALYAIGSLASYWAVGRVVALVG
jgi:hypothetical protein